MVFLQREAILEAAVREVPSRTIVDLDGCHSRAIVELCLGCVKTMLGLRCGHDRAMLRASYGYVKSLLGLC